MRYTKADVEFHAERYTRRPAVNVKVYGCVTAKTIEDVRRDESAHEGFTLEWYEAYAERDREGWMFQDACEQGWEQIKIDAEEIFGKHVKVYSQGRGGGWAVVVGLPDFESWDAVMLSKWRKFERYAKQAPQGVPYSMAWSAYANGYEPEHAEKVAAYVADVETNTWSNPGVSS